MLPVPEIPKLSEQIPHKPGRPAAHEDPKPRRTWRDRYYEKRQRDLFVQGAIKRGSQMKEVDK